MENSPPPRRTDAASPAHSARSAPGLASALLAGPRGRRLLLAFAAHSEPRERGEDSFGSAAFYAAYALEPHRGAGGRSLIGDVGMPPWEPPRVGPAEVARRLAELTLAEPTAAALRECLTVAVDSARYWQEPDGEDLLAASAPMRVALARVAAHVAAAPAAAWWRGPAVGGAQWRVGWEGVLPAEDGSGAHDILRAAREADIEGERVAARERPADPAARVSGHWWSTPPRELITTTRPFPDGSPVGLWCVEDRYSWESARARRVEITPAPRIYEIDGARSWAALCARFPLDQSAQKRHDWYRATGRVGDWVVPDWAAVAGHYDAVHLSVEAYLSAAGTAIPVGEGAASAIAGWGPDETFWLGARVRALGEPEDWRLAEENAGYVWVRA